METRRAEMMSAVCETIFDQSVLLADTESDFTLRASKNEKESWKEREQMGKGKCNNFFQASPTATWPSGRNLLVKLYFFPSRPRGVPCVYHVPCQISHQRHPRDDKVFRVLCVCLFQAQWHTNTKTIWNGTVFAYFFLFLIQDSPLRVVFLRGWIFIIC